MIYVHKCLYKIIYGSTFCNGKCLGTIVREHILSYGTAIQRNTV